MIKTQQAALSPVCFYGILMELNEVSTNMQTVTGGCVGRGGEGSHVPTGDTWSDAQVTFLAAPHRPLHCHLSTSVTAEQHKVTSYLNPDFIRQRNYLMSSQGMSTCPTWSVQTRTSELWEWEFDKSFKWMLAELISSDRAGERCVKWQWSWCESSPPERSRGFFAFSCRRNLSWEQ